MLLGRGGSAPSILGPLPPDFVERPGQTSSVGEQWQSSLQASLCALHTEQANFAAVFDKLEAQLVELSASHVLAQADQSSDSDLSLQKDPSLVWPGTPSTQAPTRIPTSALRPETAKGLGPSASLRKSILKKGTFEPRDSESAALQDELTNARAALEAAQATQTY